MSYTELLSLVPIFNFCHKIVFFFFFRFVDWKDCFAKTWQEGKLSAMYRGIGFTLIRAAPVAATILPIYEYTKEFITDR